MVARKVYGLDPNALNVPWLESPFSAQLLQRANLNSEEMSLCEKFSRDGYAVIDLNLDESFCEPLIHGLEGAYHEGGAPTFSSSHRIENAWSISDKNVRQGVLGIANSNKVLDALRLLYKREPMPFQTLNFPRGTQQRTHSDTIHFHSKPARFMCGVWVALEDVHPDAGPLHYYKGSHKLPIYDLFDLGLSAYGNKDAEGNAYGTSGPAYKHYEDFLEDLVKAQGLTRERAIIKRGQALIWSANLLHGGDPIINPALSRHSQVTHYYFENATYYAPLMSDPFLGQIFSSSVLNLRTMQPIKHYYNGAEIQPETCVLPEGPIKKQQHQSADFDLKQLEEPGSVRANILVWPDYENKAELFTLADEYGALMVANHAGRLCLRYDSALDIPLRDAIANLQEAFALAELDMEEIDIVLLNGPMRIADWSTLSSYTTCVLQTSSVEGERQAFLKEVKVPVLHSRAEFAAILAEMH
ncbi:MAG: phytanoyl-CoA dioxygenase family protein [Myxococcota bacterium]|nr:phytanoyl-CoA dioxygenase family protein [Myxococcota bacterium]